MCCQIILAPINLLTTPKKYTYMEGGRNQCQDWWCVWGQAAELTLCLMRRDASRLHPAVNHHSSAKGTERTQQPQKQLLSNQGSSKVKAVPALPHHPPRPKELQGYSYSSRFDALHTHQTLSPKGLQDCGESDLQDCGESEPAFYLSNSITSLGK